MKPHEAQDPASPRIKRLKIWNSSTAGSMAINQEVVDLTSSPPSSQTSSAQSPNKSVYLVKPKQPTSQIAPKKIIIKNLRNVPRADPNQYFDQVWGQLDAALSAIFQDAEVPYSLEDLYKGVENLCRQDRGFALYKNLSEKCKKELVSQLRHSMTEETDNIANTAVLQAISGAWSAWNARLVRYYP